MDKIKVLFLAANPVETIQLKLDEEVRSITQKIRASEYRDSLQLVSAWAVRPDDLLQLLNEHKPHIVHFSGHGSHLGEIILVDNSGAAKIVTPKALKALFTTLKDNVRVVILNACYSKIQANAIAEVIDCAVGMNAAIGDSAAIIFAASFYRAIGFSRSIQESFDQGITALLLEGIDEENTPDLIVKKHIDPAQVFLVDLVPKHLTEETELVLSISVSNDFSEDSFFNSLIKAEDYFDLRRTLNYQIYEEGQKTRISFSMDYLADLNSGGEISDIDTGALVFPQRFFKWQFPKLDLRLVNNSSKTVFITDVILDVEQSILDPSPVILLPKEEPNIFHFALLNLGWGSIQNSFIKFNLVPWGESFSFDGLYSYEMRIKDYLDDKKSEWYGCEYYNIDVSEALKQSGVKIEDFGKRDPNDFANGFNANFPRMRFFQDFLFNKNVALEEYQDWEKEQLERFLILLDALGSFKNGKNCNKYGGRYSALAYGELHFQSMSAERKLEQKGVKFSTEVPLIISGMYGAGAQSSYQYDAKLDIDRENYQVIVKGRGSSVSQYLKTGDVDRFHILVGAEKSSIHTFRIKLIYNDSKVLISPKIELSIFVPRIESENIRERHR